MTYLRAKHRGEVKRQSITCDRLYESHKQFFSFVEDNVILDETKSILDLGCGMGSFTILLANSFSSHVEGWDINQRFLTSARRRARRNHVGATRLHFRRVGFFEAVPSMLQEKYDAIFFRETVMCIKNPAELLLWARQLLKPNGHVFALEPDYGMTVIYPEIPYWAEFLEEYRQFGSRHDENYLFGRSLVAVFKIAGVKPVAIQPLVEIHTSLDRAALKRFMAAEVFSIKQDMKRFVRESGYCRKKITEMLAAMSALHNQSGAYVQTHMVGICGQIG